MDARRDISQNSFSHEQSHRNTYMEQKKTPGMKNIYEMRTNLN